MPSRTRTDRLKYRFRLSIFQKAFWKLITETKGLSQTVIYKISGLHHEDFKNNEVNEHG